MKILIAAATSFELEPFINSLNGKEYESPHEFYICLTGVGMLHTASNLTKAIVSFKPDIAIQAGIAGAFNCSLKLGDIVLVKSEQYGDLGIEDKTAYLDIFETGLIDPNVFPYEEGRLINPTDKLITGGNLPLVKGLTVNKVSGETGTILFRSKKYECDIESMEGAAFHYVCLNEEIPFVQLRAISNYVEPRDKSRWKIDLAIKNLNDYLIKELLENEYGKV